MAQDDKRGGWDLLPIVVLALLVGLLLLGWWLYPILMHSLATQDCIATGRTNCT